MCKPKILLVDDSENILKALKRTFRMLDYEIACATSAAEALAIVATEDIDLIISDETMPGVTGTELLRQIRELYPDIIRIMLTGNNDIEVAKNAINQGEIRWFFTKPWDDTELTAAVKMALEVRALGKENVRLKEAIAEKERMIRSLESEHPGITERKLEPDGSIVID